MSTRLALATLLPLVLCGMSACGGPWEAAGSPFCDALGAPVPGIKEIVWDNGFTRGVATWGSLLDDGIRQADAATRHAAAEAVRADTEGFETVMETAPDELRPQLRQLRSLLLDPDAVLQRREDPDVVAAVRSVTDASPPDVCGWMR